MQAQPLASSLVDQRAKVYMGRDVLFSRPCQGSLIHLMLEIAGERTMSPDAAIQRPGPVTVVDGKDIAAPQQTRGTPYPAQRSEINFCSPSIAKLRPRYL